VKDNKEREYCNIWWVANGLGVLLFYHVAYIFHATDVN
jgi:hypothetical protein